MKKCPKCGSTSFVVTGVVEQDWRVDQNGDFVECLTECAAVLHYPNDDDLWDCLGCGYAASGREFNVE